MVSSPLKYFNVDINFGSPLMANIWTVFFPSIGMPRKICRLNMEFESLSYNLYYSNIFQVVHSTSNHTEMVTSGINQFFFIKLVKCAYSMGLSIFPELSAPVDLGNLFTGYER